MKTYVISDIHGCYNTFISLLEKINFSKSDELYLLGDYIDKGKRSNLVLDKIIELQENNYKVFPIRGNHEQNMLDASLEYDKETFTSYTKLICKSGNLLNNDGQLFDKYRNFMRSLKYYYKVGNFYLVHASINFKADKPFEDYSYMMYGRNTNIDVSKLGGKTLVHGHQVTNIEIIKKAVAEKAQVIPLDNGCVYTKKRKMYDVTKLGNLCCLELNNFELITQKCID